MVQANQMISTSENGRKLFFFKDNQVFAHCFKINEVISTKNDLNDHFWY